MTPSSGQYSALVLNPAAQADNFSYIGTDGITRTVNLLSLAGQNGFPSTVNPVMVSQLRKIQQSTSAGAISPSDLIRNSLVWVAPQPVTQYCPMRKIDWLITSNLRFNASDTWARTVNARGFRGTVLPGSFQQQQSYGQIANPLLVNDFNFGIQGTQETFNTG